MDAKTQDLPAPLLGCLYCHAEGTIIQSEGRKFFGWGSNVLILSCTHCGAIALFEPGVDAFDWRIRYRKFSRESQYYFVSIHLGKAGWLKGTKAIDISTRAFIQRHRLRQTQRGDLSWLSPAVLPSPPPLMTPGEPVYVSIRYVTYRQARRFPRPLHAETDNILDAGMFYLTASKIHLLGHQRDWSYRLSEIYLTQYTRRAWFIFLKNGELFEYFQGEFNPEEMDGQLLMAVVERLAHK